jgi:hypothetical protein
MANHGWFVALLETDVATLLDRECGDAGERSRRTDVLFEGNA